MNNGLPTLLVTLQNTKDDPALLVRGDRKLIVTEIFESTEEEAQQDIWKYRGPSEKCPVMIMKDTESAVFTELAKQTRHYHKKGTELYLVLEGVMKIEVAGKEYSLSPGDMIVVNPGAYHEVKREGTFLCRVITLHCGGRQDRFEN